MSLSKTIRFEVLKRDSFKCQHCGASAPEELLQVDHVTPQAKGGTDDLWNLVASCHRCNSGKSDRELTDDAVVTKAKRQLDELQERREQLDMLMDWQRGLSDLKQNTVNEVVSFCNEHINGKLLNEAGIKTIARLLSKYGTEQVLAAIGVSATQYLEATPGGLHTSQSVDIFIDRIGGICEINRRSEANPRLKDLYYIRGILRRVLDGRYYDHHRAIEILEAADSWRVPVDQLTRAAKRCSSWSSFIGLVNDLIEEAKISGS